MCPSLTQPHTQEDLTKRGPLLLQPKFSVVRLRLHFPYLKNVTHKTEELEIFRIERFCGKWGLRITLGLQVNCI